MNEIEAMLEVAQWRIRNEREERRKECHDPIVEDIDEIKVVLMDIYGNEHTRIIGNLFKNENL